MVLIVYLTKEIFKWHAQNISLRWLTSCIIVCIVIMKNNNYLHYAYITTVEWLIFEDKNFDFANIKI